MPSSQLVVLEAEPIDADLDSEFDLSPADAETALLRDFGTSRDESHPPAADRKPVLPARHRHYLRVIGLSICAAFLIELGDFIQKAPTMRAFEDILCRKYYESISPLGSHISLPIPEGDCKNAVVQGELAMLKGWDVTFSCIPGMLLALPFGYISDRYGRKIVLLLSLLGVTLGLAWVIFIVSLGTAVDIRWVWASNVFLCIGGGAAVIKAALYAMFADVTPENQRAAVFFQFIAASMVSALVAVPVTWKIMQTSSVLAMEVGLAFICSGLFLALFLPETLERGKVSEVSARAERSDAFHQDEGLVQREQVLSIFGVIKGSHFILATPALRTLIITFLTGPILITSMGFIVQLVSERYNLSLADANFVTPFSAVSTLIMLVVVLPLTYSVLGSRFGMRPVLRDLVVARVSVVFLILGSLAIGLAPSPGLLIAGTVIVSIGAGYVSAIRSLITSYVHADQVSRLFAVIAVIETMGSLVASPLISKSFSWGMNLGGTWSGITYILTAAMMLILAIPVYIIRPPKPEEDVHG